MDGHDRDKFCKSCGQRGGWRRTADEYSTKTGELGGRYAYCCPHYSQGDLLHMHESDWLSEWFPGGTDWLID